MSILKELLEINEKQERLEEAARKQKAKKVRNAKAKNLADGSDAEFKKDRPFMKDPHYPQWVPGNTFINMTKSGPRAGDLE